MRQKSDVLKPRRARNIPKGDLAECGPYHRRRIPGNWGVQIPTYMNPIKVAMHAAQRGMLYPPENSAESVEDDAEKVSQRRIEGVKEGEDDEDTETTRVSNRGMLYCTLLARDSLQGRATGGLS